MKPVLLVIARPNGAGKTTVTRRLRVERWTEARRNELLAAGEGIAFETVFSSPGKVDFVARAKARGYFVRIFFIGTSDPRINAARCRSAYDWRSRMTMQASFTVVCAVADEPHW